MRDLDQLEEQDPEERRRRLGTVVLAALVTGALTVAVGVLISRTAEPQRANQPDPLDQLDNALGATTTDKNSASANEPTRDPLVDPTKLTFERDLTEHEDRPEVIEALEAAAREEETLEQARKQPSADAKPDDEQLTVHEAASRDPSAADEPEDQDVAPALTVHPTALPAGFAASSASAKLARAARHDKLVAAALPKQAAAPRAPVGTDGEFTLQVMSYDTPAAARSFANALRAKGYAAFVTTGEVSGRGRSYRVRIGPFHSRQQAEVYRRTFDAQERMNTIVVRRGDNESAEH